ncbi:MAG: endonuclease [Saprospiraceae bacterium]
MKFTSIFFFLISLIFSNKMQAQQLHLSILPDLEGQELLDSLVSRYKTYQLLPYSICRDTLFSKIDVVQDSLECIYTGMKRYLPPGVDATEAVLLNGQANGINTEHTYPQSKGAEGYGRSDMHILYPSRVRTNSNRLNNPFGDIDDGVTQTWYYLTNEMSSPPSVNRNAYSESTSTKFEPRESVKGNIARSVFYFYTMYHGDAINADPNFFNLQVQDLCKWHFEDAVDSTEWKRTFGINEYQKNINPFVLDCSLAARTYCQNISDVCALLSDTKNEKLIRSEFKLYPNPGVELIILEHSLGSGNYAVYVNDLHGKTVSTQHGFSDQNSIQITLPYLPNGVYFIHFQHDKDAKFHVFKYISNPY